MVERKEKEKTGRFFKEAKEYLGVFRTTFPSPCSYSRCDRHGRQLKRTRAHAYHSLIHVYIVLYGT